MQCDRAQEQLFDYLENALTPAMRQVLDHHLSECVACKTQLSELRSAYQLLDEGLPEIAVPLGFRASVLSAVSEQPKPLSLAGRIQNWFLPHDQSSRVSAFGFGAVALLVIVGAASISLNHQGKTPNPVLNLQPSAGMVPSADPQLVIQNEGIVQSVHSFQKDGHDYHVFGMHLPSKSEQTTVNSYVLLSDSVLSDADRINDPTVAVTAPSLSLNPGTSYDLPIAVPSNVPVDKSLTLLSEWSDSKGLHKEVCFVPLSDQPVSNSASVAKGESLFDALATVAATSDTSIFVSDKAASDLTQPISRGLDMSDATVNDALADLALPAHLTFTRQADGSYVIR